MSILYSLLIRSDEETDISMSTWEWWQCWPRDHHLMMDLLSLRRRMCPFPFVKWCSWNCIFALFKKWTWHAIRFIILIWKDHQSWQLLKGMRNWIDIWYIFSFAANDMIPNAENLFNINVEKTPSHFFFFLSHW